MDGLNTFLADAISHLELGTRERRINLERVYVARDARQFLAPLAEAIAELLANCDFDLVRHCEGESCVLWFYDRTKGHRRRWCTAEGCGTRARVAAFRKACVRVKVNSRLRCNRPHCHRIYPAVGDGWKWQGKLWQDA